MISICIPSYNRSEILYRTLYSLFKQNDTDYEVLVANDDDEDKAGATNEVCETFINFGMPLKVFQTRLYKRGRNFTSEGWNTGEGWSNESYPFNVLIRNSIGDIIILNSGDTMSVTNTIDQHRQWQKTHEKTCLVSTVHGMARDCLLKIDELDWKNARNLLYDGSSWHYYVGPLGQTYLKGLPIQENKRPFHFQMSLPREALFDIRGFDEDFYGYMPYGDDDIACRLRKWGITFHWSLDVVAIHQWHPEPEAISSKRTSAVSNPKFSGEYLFESRLPLSIVRNASHEWGQYPRDMKNLPEQSGAKT